MVMSSCSSQQNSLAEFGIFVGLYTPDSGYGGSPVNDLEWLLKEYPESAKEARSLGSKM